LLAGKAIRSAVYPRISTAGSLQRQSLDFGPFLQQQRASSRLERKNSQSVTPRVYPSARRCEGQWDFAVGSASIDLTSLTQTAKRVQGYSLSAKKLTFLDSPGSVIIPAWAL